MIIDVGSSIDTGELLTGHDEGPAAICHVIMHALHEIGYQKGYTRTS